MSPTGYGLGRKRQGQMKPSAPMRATPRTAGAQAPFSGALRTMQAEAGGATNRAGQPVSPTAQAGSRNAYAQQKATSAGLQQSSGRPDAQPWTQRYSSKQAQGTATSPYGAALRQMQTQAGMGSSSFPDPDVGKPRFPDPDVGYAAQPVQAYGGGPANPPKPAPPKQYTDAQPQQASVPAPAQGSAPSGDWLVDLMLQSTGGQGGPATPDGHIDRGTGFVGSDEDFLGGQMRHTGAGRTDKPSEDKGASTYAAAIAQALGAANPGEALAGMAGAVGGRSVVKEYLTADGAKVVVYSDGTTAKYDADGNYIGAGTTDGGGKGIGGHAAETLADDGSGDDSMSADDIEALIAQKLYEQLMGGDGLYTDEQKKQQLHHMQSLADQAKADQARMLAAFGGIGGAEGIANLGNIDAQTLRDYGDWLTQADLAGEELDLAKLGQFGGLWEGMKNREWAKDLFEHDKEQEAKADIEIEQNNFASSVGAVGFQPDAKAKATLMSQQTGKSFHELYEEGYLFLEPESGLLYWDHSKDNPNAQSVAGADAGVSPGQSWAEMSPKQRNALVLEYMHIDPANASHDGFQAWLASKWGITDYDGTGWPEHA